MALALSRIKLLLVAQTVFLSLTTSFCSAASHQAQLPAAGTRSQTAAGDLRPLFDQAQKERNNGQIEKSRKLFEQIVQAGTNTYYGEHAQIILKTEYPVQPVSPACEAIYKKAENALRQNNYRDALTYFTELTRLYPKFEWGHSGLANIYMRMEDTEKAAHEARTILTTNENFVEAWYVLTHDAMAHQDLKGAIDSASRAHELDPYNVTISSLLNRLKDQAKTEEPD